MTRYHGMIELTQLGFYSGVQDARPGKKGIVVRHAVHTCLRLWLRAPMPSALRRTEPWPPVKLVSQITGISELTPNAHVFKCL
jgi:hypothetical protein